MSEKKKIDLTQFKAAKEFEPLSPLAKEELEGIIFDRDHYEKRVAVLEAENKEPKDRYGWESVTSLENKISVLEAEKARLEDIINVSISALYAAQGYCMGTNTVTETMINQAITKIEGLEKSDGREGK